MGSSFLSFCLGFRLSFRALAGGALVLAVVVGCDGTLPPSSTGTGGTGGRSAVPATHRATANPCSAQVDGGPAGQSAPDAAVNVPCLADSDCPPCATGQRDRCLVRSAASNVCVCDQCNTDQDCPATQACVCNQTGWSITPVGNQCVDGNCRVDADCGPGGFCSLTVAGCGYGGYYCHTAADKCLSDSDCATSGFGCIYSPTTGAWGCGSIVCSG